MSTSLPLPKPVRTLSEALAAWARDPGGLRRWRRIQLKGIAAAFLVLPLAVFVLGQAWLLEELPAGHFLRDPLTLGAVLAFLYPGILLAALAAVGSLIRDRWTEALRLILNALLLWTALWMAVTGVRGLLFALALLASLLVGAAFPWRLLAWSALLALFAAFAETAHLLPTLYGWLALGLVGLAGAAGAGWLLSRTQVQASAAGALLTLVGLLLQVPLAVVAFARIRDAFLLAGPTSLLYTPLGLADRLRSLPAAFFLALLSLLPLWLGSEPRTAEEG